MKHIQADSLKSAPLPAPLPKAFVVEPPSLSAHIDPFASKQRLLRSPVAVSNQSASKTEHGKLGHLSYTNNNFFAVVVNMVSSTTNIAETATTIEASQLPGRTPYKGLFCLYLSEN